MKRPGGGRGRPQLGRASRVNEEVGTEGKLSGRGRGWGGAALSSPSPPTHPLATSEAPGPAPSPVGGGSRMLVEAEGAGRVPPQLGWQGPGGACAAAGASPPPHPLPMQPSLRRAALAWWGEDSGGQGPSLPEAGPRDPGGPGSQVTEQGNVRGHPGLAVPFSPTLGNQQVL